MTSLAGAAIGPNNKSASNATLRSTFTNILTTPKKKKRCNQSEILPRDPATSSSNETALAVDNGGVLSETIKIVVFGSACCGKTSLIRQFVGNGQEFSDQYDPTDRKSNYFKTVLSFDSNTQKITHWALKIVGKLIQFL